MVQEKTGLKEQLFELRWNIVNAILEGNFEFLLATEEVIKFNPGRLGNIIYYYDHKHFMHGYISGLLFWKLSEKERELVEHVLSEYIPQNTVCECCGQKCKK